MTQRPNSSAAGLTSLVALSLLALLFFGWNSALAEEPPETAPDNADAGYILGPGDQVRVEVFNQDDLTGDYVLDGEGRFSVPLIGTVRAAGLTTGELEDLLVGKLKPDYLVNPLIIVEVRNYRPYYLIGEVQGTGGYPYIDGITYLRAVAIAGGFTYRSKKDHVWVVRADSKDGEEIKLDINDKVMPGDIIRIAERLF